MTLPSSAIEPYYNRRHGKRTLDTRGGAEKHRAVHTSCALGCSVRLCSPHCRCLGCHVATLRRGEPRGPTDHNFTVGTYETTVRAPPCLEAEGTCPPLCLDDTRSNCACCGHRASHGPARRSDAQHQLADGMVSLTEWHLRRGANTPAPINQTTEAPTHLPSKSPKVTSTPTWAGTTNETNGSRARTHARTRTHTHVSSHTQVRSVARPALGSMIFRRVPSSYQPMRSVL
jgi:hypothetical protein